MGDLWETLMQQAAEKIETYLTARFERLFMNLFRSNIKVIYSEKEAAQELGVSVQALQAWRKDGLINYCAYPPVRQVEGGPRRAGIYSYDLADLLDFRSRYKILSVPPKFHLVKNVSLLGANVEEKTNVRRIG